ncbi:MAG: tellurite resistance/C4-dicarboxylate transporter family protein [Thermoanaerobaculia bacterium]
MTGSRALTQPRWKRAVEEFSAVNFAMVMATGIVSIAAELLGWEAVGIILFWVNVTAFALFLVMMTARVALFPRRVFSEMIDHMLGAGYFTAVAASCILGTQLIRLFGNYHLAMVLWIFGIVLWVGLTYTFFTALTVKEEKPLLNEGISGAWLVAVVATQSIAILSTLMAAHWPQPWRLMANFLGLSMWLWGGMLYIWMISLIFYRYTFFKFPPGDLTPPYWINMGAMAISTLAGSLLIVNSGPEAPYLMSLRPFLEGFTVFYWATGTWWIPMLVLLGFWRYVYKGYPLQYDPLYWGAVFPLGMYTAATFQMAHAMKLGFLLPLPRGFFFIALGAWLMTFVGLCRSSLRSGGMALSAGGGRGV